MVPLPRLFKGSGGLLESVCQGAIRGGLKYEQPHVDQERIFPFAYRGEYIDAYISDIVVELRKSEARG